jgi:hypothetical protein
MVEFTKYAGTVEEELQLTFKPCLLPVIKFGTAEKIFEKREFAAVPKNTSIQFMKKVSREQIFFAFKFEEGDVIIKNDYGEFFPCKNLVFISVYRTAGKKYFNKYLQEIDHAVI